MAQATVSFEPTNPTKVTLELTHEEASFLTAVISSCGGNIGEYDPAKGKNFAHNTIGKALRDVGYDYTGVGPYSKLAQRIYSCRSGKSIMFHLPEAAQDNRNEPC